MAPRTIGLCDGFRGTESGSFKMATTTGWILLRTQSLSNFMMSGPESTQITASRDEHSFCFLIKKPLSCVKYLFILPREIPGSGQVCEASHTPPKYITGRVTTKTRQTEQRINRTLLSTLQLIMKIKRQKEKSLRTWVINTQVF